MARTKTYIAGDWDNDFDAIERLYRWNESNHWGLSFSDAHSLTQSRDSSLNCTIKQSLTTRLNSSKTFVLVVGEHTDYLRAGACYLCSDYVSNNQRCKRYRFVDNRSYIDFECEKAVADGLNIIVLYKNTYRMTSKCPDILRNKGLHVPMMKNSYGFKEWDYQAVKSAFDTYK